MHETSLPAAIILETICTGTTLLSIFVCSIDVSIGMSKLHKQWCLAQALFVCIHQHTAYICMYLLLSFFVATTDTFVPMSLTRNIVALHSWASRKFECKPFERHEWAIYRVQQSTTRSTVNSCKLAELLYKLPERRRTFHIHEECHSYNNIWANKLYRALHACIDSTTHTHTHTRAVPGTFMSKLLHGKRAQNKCWKI